MMSDSMALLVFFEIITVLVMLCIVLSVVLKKTRNENKKLRNFVAKTKQERVKVKELLAKNPSGNNQNQVQVQVQVQDQVQDLYGSIKQYFETQYQDSKSFYQGVSAKDQVVLDAKLPEVSQLAALRVMFLEAEIKSSPDKMHSEQGWQYFGEVFEPVLKAYKTIEAQRAGGDSAANSLKALKEEFNKVSDELGDTKQELALLKQASGGFDIDIPELISIKPVVEEVVFEQPISRRKPLDLAGESNESAGAGELGDDFSFNSFSIDAPGDDAAKGKVAEEAVSEKSPEIKPAKPKRKAIGLLAESEEFVDLENYGDNFSLDDFGLDEDAFKVTDEQAAAIAEKNRLAAEEEIVDKPVEQSETDSKSDKKSKRSKRQPLGLLAESDDLGEFGDNFSLDDFGLDPDQFRVTDEQAEAIAEQNTPKAEYSSSDGLGDDASFNNFGKRAADFQGTDAQGEQIANAMDPASIDEELKQYGKKAKETIQELQSRTREQRETIEKLQQDLQQQVAAREDKVLSLEEAKVEEQGRSKMLLKMMGDSDKIVHSLEKEFEVIQHELEEMNLKYEAQLLEKSRISAKAGALKIELQNAASEMAEMKTQLITLRESQRTKEAEIKNLQNEISSDQTQLEKMNTDLAAMRESNKKIPEIEQKFKEDLQQKDAELKQMAHQMAVLAEASASKAELEDKKGEIEQLNKQVSSMLSMIGTANHSNNDLQLVLQFASDVVNSEALAEVAEKVLAIAGSFGVGACLQVRGKEKTINASTVGDITATELAIIDAIDPSIRFKDMKTAMLINMSNITVLIKGIAADDKDIRKRLKGSLGTAVEIASEEIKKMESDEQLQYQRDMLHKALADTRTTIKNVNVQLAYQASEAKTILNMLFQNLGQGLTGAKMSKAQREIVVQTLNDSKRRFALLFSSNENSTFSMLMRQLGGKESKKKNVEH